MKNLFWFLVIGILCSSCGRPNQSSNAEVPVSSDDINNASALLCGAGKKLTEKPQLLDDKFSNLWVHAVVFSLSKGNNRCLTEQTIDAKGHDTNIGDWELILNPNGPCLPNGTVWKVKDHHVDGSYYLYTLEQSTTGTAIQPITLMATPTVSGLVARDQVGLKIYNCE